MYGFSFAVDVRMSTTSRELSEKLNLVELNLPQHPNSFIARAPTFSQRTEIPRTAYRLRRVPNLKWFVLLLLLFYCKPSQNIILCAPQHSVYTHFTRTELCHAAHFNRIVETRWYLAAAFTANMCVCCLFVVERRWCAYVKTEGLHFCIHADTAEDIWKVHPFWARDSRVSKLPGRVFGCVRVCFLFLFKSYMDNAFAFQLRKGCAVGFCGHAVVALKMLRCLACGFVGRKSRVDFDKKGGISRIWLRTKNERFRILFGRYMQT